MTGRIAGGTPPRRSARELDPVYRGSNQVGLRAFNERLVLSLIRIHGQLSKVQIAEITGLTAQTASVIVRALEADGLLMAGAPQRGKVGQPSVPILINPNGVLFLGLRLGPRNAELALVNFVGRILVERSQMHEHLDPEAIKAFVRTALDAILREMSAAQRARLHGMGIATAPDLVTAGNGPAKGDAAGAAISIDKLVADIEALTDLPVLAHNEAMAACSAELAYGLGGGISDFLYIHLGDEIDGGIVQQGRIPQLRSGLRSGIGRMLVPGPDGGLKPLGSLGIRDGFDLSPDIVSDSAEARGQIEAAACGIAHAAHIASTLLPLGTAVVDGNLPPAMRRKIVQAARRRLAGAYGEDAGGLTIREGTMGRQGATLGAACLPLLDGFFINAGGSLGR